MKKYKFILALITLFIIAGCYSVTGQLLPSSNKGRYSVTLGESEIKSEDKTVTIRGHVFDIKTGKPLNDATVIAGCFKFQTTPQGEYSFRTTNINGPYFYMEAFVYPYRPVDTDIINIYNRKEVIIDFYLAIDDRPMFDCTTGWTHDQMQKELNNLK
jgi:hypothetical protein